MARDARETDGITKFIRSHDCSPGLSDAATWRETRQSVAATVTSEGKDGNLGALLISIAVNKLGIVGNLNQSQAKELKVMKRILRFSWVVYLMHLIQNISLQQRT